MLTSKIIITTLYVVLAKLLCPAPINLKPSLKLHFDDIWAGTYGTFCKVAGKNDVYVFGLNNYYQLGEKILLCYVFFEAITLFLKV